MSNSCPAGAACLKTGRHFIGIDIDQQCVIATNKRLEDITKSGALYKMMQHDVSENDLHYLARPVIESTASVPE
jgi:UDP-N-acetyl-D-mannosaminuronate dehydrogenase